MALKLSSLLLQDSFTTLISKLRLARDQIQSTVVRIDSGATADEVINITRHLSMVANTVQEAKATPGMAQYARDQYGDATVDIVTELNDILTAIQSAVAWVVANFPKDASGYLLKDKIVDGVIVNRTFTPTQMAGLKTQLTSIASKFN